MLKLCGACNIEKPLSDFYANSTRKDGKDTQCAECKRAYGKRYRQRNASKIKEKDREYRQANKNKLLEYNKEWLRNNTNKAREYKYRARYGIDLAVYDNMLRAQGGACKICGALEPGRGNYFIVDHCHDTNEVRGLLCDNCNKGLGHFKDSKDILTRAINYLD